MREVKWAYIPVSLEAFVIWNKNKRGPPRVLKMENTSTSEVLLYSTSNYTSNTYPTSQNLEQLLVRVRDEMHNSTGGNSFIGNFQFLLLLRQGVMRISLQVRVEQHNVRCKIRNRMYLPDDADSSSY